MSSKPESLADKIASLLTTTPTTFDPEDDNIDETKANVSYSKVDEEHEESTLPVKSKIRQKNLDYLADIDERYAGKKGTRKDLDSDEFSSEDDHDERVDNNNESDGSENDDNNGSENDDEDVPETDDSEDDGEQDYSDLDDSHINKDENFKTLNDTSSTVQKGRCVKNQMIIWENLLEMRIQLQKCMLSANKMPRPEKYKEIKEESGQEFISAVQQTKKSLLSVLDKFLLLQNLLWKQNPDMKKFNAKKDSNTNNDDDEEIPSDTEDEMIEEENEDPQPKKKMKLSEFEKEIEDKHKSYTPYRNSVIQKWYDKTRLPVMKNNTAPHSIINHIEHTLADKAKLIKRTQLKRTEYAIIGEEPSEDADNQEEYNNEIFDDNDFYHQLLRELIEVKSADLTDPVQLGRQWIQLQNLRSKMKRKIDTRATKGRKIRYAVHTKLVNFMAPIDYNTWTDEAKTELFGSLFGKNQA